MNIKMADVFSGDVTADADSLLAIGYGVLADFSGYKKQCRYTAVAINSHDENQALIAKQAEQIKMLREALILATPYLPFNAAEEEKAYQALEATKEQA